MSKKEYLLSIVTIFIVTVIVTVFSDDKIINFPSVSSINRVVERDGTLWVASAGGLFKYDPKTEKTISYRNYTDFPDMNLTSIVLDSSNNIWISTKLGYIYKIVESGKLSIYSVYNAANWGINCINIYNNYLLIASPKGFSLFNINTTTILQSTIGIGDFSSPAVNFVDVIAGTFVDTAGTFNEINRLYIGLIDGYAYIDITDDLSKNNFYDVSIWNTDTTVKNVKAILIYNDSLIISNEPHAVWRGDLYSAVDTAIYKNGKELCSVRSSVNSIDFGDDHVWFSTLENYFYGYDEESCERVKLDGLSSEVIQRVFVDSRKKTWILPYVLMKPETAKAKDNIAITTLEGASWGYFNSSTGNFGSMGDGTNFFGVAEDINGDIWLGANGSGVRKLNYKTGSWDRYQTKNNEFYKLPEGKGPSWSKNDVIASDKNGNLWISQYANSTGGSLLCYNPKRGEPKSGNYKYYLSKKSGYNIFNPIALSCDSANNILVGGAIKLPEQIGDWNGGRLVIFTYNTEDPTTGGLKTVAVDTLLDIVTDIVSFGSNYSLIASGQGLILYSSKSAENTELYTTTGIPNLSVVNSIAIASAQKDYDGNYNLSLWLSFSAGGFVKTKLRVSFNSDETVASATFDQDSTTTYASLQSHGQIIVNDLNYNRDDGVLWLATNNGVVRYYEGTNYIAVKESKNISAFPNPYIKSRHKKITFTHLTPNSTVLVYSVDGRLVANIRDSGGNGNRNRFEWSYTWTPNDNIKPGTYIYTSNDPDNKKGNGLGKILILP